MRFVQKDVRAMKAWTVKELARISGVSVRTLHHYDEIGLLKPAFVGENGYRRYRRPELLRLQQILVWRELDIPLREIAALLDSPGFDLPAALREQRGRLAEKAGRYALLLATIDRTIADLEGERTMEASDLYAGTVAPEKQAEYEQWLRRRFGAGIEPHLQHARKRVDAMTADERRVWMAELADIEGALAEAMRRGLPPDLPALDAPLARHFAWTTSQWATQPPRGAYGQLGEMYRQHPDFVARYEAIAPGFTGWLAAAMAAWAARG